MDVHDLLMYDRSCIKRENRKQKIITVISHVPMITVPQHATELTEVYLNSDTFFFLLITIAQLLLVSHICICVCVYMIIPVSVSN